MVLLTFSQTRHRKCVSVSLGRGGEGKVNVFSIPAFIRNKIVALLYKLVRQSRVMRSKCSETQIPTTWLCPSAGCAHVEFDEHSVPIYYVVEQFFAVSPRDRLS